MSEPVPAFQKRPAPDPIQEARAYVAAMRGTGQKIGADLIDAAFEAIQAQAREEVVKAMLRVLRENRHQALADALVKRLGELWGSGVNLDDFYG